MPPSRRRVPHFDPFIKFFAVYFAAFRARCLASSFPTSSISSVPILVSIFCFPCPLACPLGWLEEPAPSLSAMIFSPAVIRSVITASLATLFIRSLLPPPPPLPVLDDAADADLPPPLDADLLPPPSPPLFFMMCFPIIVAAASNAACVLSSLRVSPACFPSSQSPDLNCAPMSTDCPESGFWHELSDRPVFFLWSVVPALSSFPGAPDPSVECIRLQ
mmetsp:Transcript_70243/g.198255  ORF Transcript_70243/g.198255 Transcript_70243/m.198255 type:complete len:218 (-) Transcript_70243:536-1189(-)